MRKTRLRTTFAWLRDLIPEPWNAEVFAERLAAARGRTILLVPADLDATDGLSGATMGTERADYVFYAASARGLRCLTILMHEFAHLGLGHVDTTRTSISELITPIPGSGQPPGPVHLRHDYLCSEEHDAELLATMLVTDVTQRAATRAHVELSRYFSR